VEQSSPRIPVESVSGSLRLANDADITVARVMCAVANKASRDTARRVAAARRRRAEAGQYSAGGPRPFGFGRDGVTVRPAEAAEIVTAADAVLAGVPIRQIVAGLRRRGVRTVTGAAWKPTTVREILRRPRNAGILVYRGEEIGPAPWPPILPEPAYRAVCAALGYLRTLFRLAPWAVEAPGASMTQPSWFRRGEPARQRLRSTTDSGSRHPAPT